MGLSMDSAPTRTLPTSGNPLPGLKIGQVLGGLFKRLLPDGDGS
jgi:hypothetical protein